MLCRSHLSKESIHNVPDRAGWVSVSTTVTQKESSIVEYLPPVNFPVTENTTVQHLLSLSQNYTRYVNQNYTIVTFDMALAMKAYQIIWQSSQHFKNAIIQTGVFHTICSYSGVLGKILRGSIFQK